MTEAIFRERFGTEAAAAARAPGRVEILGNHTDYNGGFVLTAAIDRHIEIAGARAEGGGAAVFSEALGREARFSVNELKHDPAEPWADYVKGVLDELRKAGVAFGGFNAVIGGDLPPGGGLSSSAALEAATALFVQALYPFEMDRLELALLCQRAENRFVGMPCGLLDQMSSLFGARDSMVFLDCLTREHETLPMAGRAPALVIVDTGAKHALVEGEYKKRRECCEEAARRFNEWLPGEIRFLRDVTAEQFEALGGRLDETVRKRARHVIEENQRVRQGAEALRAGDYAALGRLMLDSHASSREWFENSCPELDAAVEAARNAPGFFGGKLSGGGFGGCTVNLVEADKAEAFLDEALMRYREKTGKEGSAILCRAGDGARILKPTA